MGWRLLCLVIGLLTLVMLVDADPTCKVTNIPKLPANLNVMNTADNTTCFKFNLTVTNTNIYFKVSPNVNVSAVSITNINATGARTWTSFRNITGSTPDYLVIGFGSGRVEVVINTTSSPSANKTIIKASNSSSDCKVTVSEAPEQLAIPDYEAAVTRPFQCTYNYQPVSNDNGVYAFTNFNFVSKSSTLKVVSLNGALTGTFQGTELPYDLVVSGKSFTVVMSVNTTTKDTFTAIKTMPTASCTKVVKVGSNSATVTSPNYPKGTYANNLDCKVLLVSTDPNRRIDLQLIDVQLANDMDRIAVIDGGSSRALISRSMAYISNLTMQRYPRDVAMVSSGLAVMVWFHTDDLGTAKGFNFTVKLADELSAMYYTPSAIQLTPKVDQTQTSKLVMISPEKTKIVFTPGALRSPTATVKCYDGRSMQSPLIASYKGMMNLYSAYSSDRHMLCMVANLHVNETFNATVHQANQSLAKFSQSLADSYSLDELVKGNVTYSWIIQPSGSSSSAIELTISRFDVSGSQAKAVVALSDLVNISYGQVTADMPLPYRIRVPSSGRLRVSVQVSLPKGVNGGAALALDASYLMANTSQVISGKSGNISSPYFPLTTPAMTNSVWMFTVPAKKSFQFTFASMFELTNNSTLMITSTLANKTVTLAGVTGPVMAPPSDVVFNNTMTNATMSVKVELKTKAQSLKTGVKMGYALLDGGYTSPLMGFPQLVRTPNFPKALNKSFTSSWLFTVPRKSKAGLLERVRVDVRFSTNTTASLDLRDGPHANSPPLLLTSSKLVNNTHTLLTSSNNLFVRYTYTSVVNKTGAPLWLLAQPDVCTNASQCTTEAGDVVCIPDAWRCDNIYQCKDGKDEKGCAPVPTTAVPGSTTAASTSSPWWTFFLSVLGGMLAGVLLVVIYRSVMARRRSNYNRLSELSPVPT